MKPTKNNKAQRVQVERFSNPKDMNDWLDDNKCTIVDIIIPSVPSGDDHIILAYVVVYFSLREEPTKPAWKVAKEAKEGDEDNVSREALL